MQRGEFTGERVATITYVCERPGAVTIPALAIHWWDVNHEELKQELLIGGDIGLGFSPFHEGDIRKQDRPKRRTTGEG